MQQFRFDLSLLGQSRHIQRTPKTNFVRYAPNSDANVIRIISAKWKIWIVREAGSKKLASRILETAFREKVRRTAIREERKSGARCQKRRISEIPRPCGSGEMIAKVSV